MNEIRIDPRDFIRINQDFCNRTIMLKQMHIVPIEEPGVIVAAESDIIDNEVFAIKNYQYEQKFRLLYSRKHENKDPQFRQIEISYKEVIIDFVQNQYKTIDEVINHMYGMLQKMTDQEWEQLSKKADKITFTNPQLK